LIKHSANHKKVILFSGYELSESTEL